MAQRVIFHVDANSAFLSWSAAYRVKVLGEEEDLRDVPSVQEIRHRGTALSLPKADRQKSTASRPVSRCFWRWKNVRI